MGDVTPAQQYRQQCVRLADERDAALAEAERLRAKTVEYVATTGGKRLIFHVVDHGTSLTVYVHGEALDE